MRHRHTNRQQMIKPRHLRNLNSTRRLLTLTIHNRNLPMPTSRLTWQRLHPTIRPIRRHHINKQRPRQARSMISSINMPIDNRQPTTRRLILTRTRRLLSRQLITRQNQRSTKSTIASKTNSKKIIRRTLNRIIHHTNRRMLNRQIRQTINTTTNNRQHRRKKRILSSSLFTRPRQATTTILRPRNHPLTKSPLSRPLR